MPPRVQAPAMQLVDGSAVVVGMSVYNITRSFNYETKLNSRLIGESTVIIANNTKRFFIVRCSKGCETKVYMSQGCHYSDGVYYGSKKEAENEWEKQRLSDIESAEKSIESLTKAVEIMKMQKPEYVK